LSKTPDALLAHLPGWQYRKWFAACFCDGRSAQYDFNPAINHKPVADFKSRLFNASRG
jgi:hypothetical protein